MFHLQAGDRYQIDAILKNLLTSGMTRIAVVYQDIPFGRSNYQFIEEQTRLRGMNIVGKASMAAGQDEATAAVAALKPSGAQAYILLLAPNSAAAFVRDARNAGDKTMLFSMSYVTPQSLLAKVGTEGAHGVALAQVTPNPASPTTGWCETFKPPYETLRPRGQTSTP